MTMMTNRYDDNSAANDNEVMVTKMTMPLKVTMVMTVMAMVTIIIIILPLMMLMMNINDDDNNMWNAVFSLIFQLNRQEFSSRVPVKSSRIQGHFRQ